MSDGFVVRCTAVASATILFGISCVAVAWAAEDGDKQVATDTASILYQSNPIEAIVVTGTRFNAELAPAKASLEAEAPQTIINRDYIENFQPPQADYVTILAITPGMTGTNVNGPGLSDGNVKNTLRGQPDGNFVMSYDGIPFGDTNGPSHHSVSYFPGSTIGSIVVDRSPGNAGTLGAATYGGNIQLYSEALVDKMRSKLAVGYGSFNTKVVNGNFQSGATGTAPSHALVNVQYTESDGALSQQGLRDTNGLLKLDHHIGENWVVTLFANYEFLQEHLNDNNGATPAQTAAFGKNFAMQNTNPALPTYYEYNKTNKRSDFDYLRLQGNVTDSLKVNDTFYTYHYVNRTFTATDIQQTAGDILANTAEGLGTTFDGVKQPLDIPGYTKLNSFRVWGNVLRVSEDYKIGSVTGQARAGIWWEGQLTSRSRYDFDMTQCLLNHVDPFNGPISNASAACGDSSLVGGGKALHVGNGYAEYDERSAWYQYEPFLELQINPIERLTLTPGVKYINWLHKTKGIEQKLRPIGTFEGEFTTTKTLPFFQANYKLTPSWSIYFDYAEGIYVPDISNFEQGTGPTAQFPAPEITKNYQAGTVFYTDNFTIDADAYDTEVTNNYIAQLCSVTGGPANETCFVNTGKAIYRGLEGETTYAFQGDLQGLQFFLNGAINQARSTGGVLPASVQLSNAPYWTAAAGVLYLSNGWKFSLIDKTTGSQWADKTNAEDPNYRISQYSVFDLNAGYTYGHFEFDLTVNNLFDSRHVVAITQNDKKFQTNRLNSLDQYFFQAPTSVMGTIKVVY